MKAGKKALDGCDHKTAYSYLMFAVSLLPEDHWDRHYDLSLHLNLLLAGAANSCCQYDEAEQFLHRGLSHARCLEDQLPSYILLSQSKSRMGYFLLFPSLLLASTNQPDHFCRSLPSAGQSERCVRYVFICLSRAWRIHSRFFHCYYVRNDKRNTQHVQRSWYTVARGRKDR